VSVRRAIRAAVGRRAIDPASVLNALSDSTLVVDGAGIVRYVNLAAEQLFGAGESHLVGRPLADFLAADSPVMAAVEQARAGRSIAEYDVALDGPRTGARLVSVRAAPVSEAPGAVALSISEQSIARRIDHQLTHRGAARSVAAMASMLGHEVKNPLSGIRGAAQLLEQNAVAEDKALTRLICEETDRIRTLVDRMEAFSDERPLPREPVNIHEVLDRVRRAAQAGFARHVRFIESYDPSLPPVLGHRDMLVQVVLNLVKNAAEAAMGEGAEIGLATAYQHGVRLAVPGSQARVHLPIVVSIADNGPGIPEDVRGNLFEPFVTTKAKGSGLGLALVAKLVADHGGVVEFDSAPRRTVFRLLLPQAAP
jgi:two-component system, NtrC family, nitrogen regulation sensor histidine kinase GlnL